MRYSRLLLILGCLFCAALAAATVTRASAPAQAPTASPIVRLTTDPGTDIRPAISPDGRMIAFQSNRGAGDRYHIWTMTSEGQNQKQLTEGQLDSRHPFWSPDGKSIVYDVNFNMIREIWLMNSDGSQKRQLTQIGADSHFPAFSPDGKQITFYVFKEGILNIWIMNADGSNQRPLVANLADQGKGQCTFACHQALFSPDSTKVAYTGGDHRSVYVINADGTNPIQIPKVSAQDHQHFPWWLPDGQLGYIIETVTNAEAYTDAFVIQLPAGTPQLLQPRMAHQGPFEWLPDTSRVIFHSPRTGNFDIFTIDLTTPAGVEALQGLKEAAVSGAEHPTQLPGGPGAPRPGAAPTVRSEGSAGGQAVVAPTPAPPAPATEPQRAAQESPLWPWFIAGLLGLMALLVLIAGVLIVFGRRGRRPT